MDQHRLCPGSPEYRSGGLRLFGGGRNDIRGSIDGGIYSSICRCFDGCSIDGGFDGSRKHCGGIGK